MMITTLVFMILSHLQQLDIAAALVTPLRAVLLIMIKIVKLQMVTVSVVQTATFMMTVARMSTVLHVIEIIHDIVHSCRLLLISNRA